MFDITLPGNHRVKQLQSSQDHCVGFGSSAVACQAGKDERAKNVRELIRQQLEKVRGSFLVASEEQNELQSQPGG
jgi:hypothetical protein